MERSKIDAYKNSFVVSHNGCLRKTTRHADGYSWTNNNERYYIFNDKKEDGLHIVFKKKEEKLIKCSDMVPSPHSDKDIYYEILNAYNSVQVMNQKYMYKWNKIKDTLNKSIYNIKRSKTNIYQ